MKTFIAHSTTNCQISLRTHTVRLWLLLIAGCIVALTSVASAQGYTIEVTPATQTAVPGVPSQYTVKIKADFGFASTINLSAFAPTLPGAVLAITPQQIGPPYSTTATLTVSANDPLPGTYVIIVEGQSGPYTIRGVCNLIVKNERKDASFWYFGYNAAIDFNMTPPQAIGNGKVNVLEGSSVMSDRHTGDLLFYTDGQQVWDINHQVMPNGSGLKGHWTSAQSALIVPNPADTTLYYVFTVGAGGYHTSDPNNNGFRYSVVDMKKRGGLGDVTIKNIDLIEHGTEKLTATRHCNGRDYWVVSHEWGSDAFCVYLVNPNGISAPIIQNIGAVTPYDANDLVNTGKFAQGCARISPNGSMLAVGSTYLNLLELFDFNNATGTISNPRVLASDTLHLYYCPEFSPDNSKLYITTLGDPKRRYSRVYQYDLEAGATNDIVNSKVRLTNVNGTWQGTQAQIGPDGKIYLGFLGSASMAVINEPNKLFPDCDYRGNSIGLAGGSNSVGLPNFIASDIYGTEAGLGPIVLNAGPDYDTVYCIGEPVQLQVTGGDTYTWTPSQGLSCTDCPNPVATPAITTSYLVSSTDATGCKTGVDVVTVKVQPCIEADVEFTYHLPNLCPGVTRRELVPYYSYGYTDTIVRVEFKGIDAGAARLDTTLPIQVRPRRNMSIPITYRWMRSGIQKSVMYLYMSSGDTIRIGISADVKTTVGPVLSTTVIHTGGRTGTFDTCLTVTSSEATGLALAWTTLASQSGARIEITSPKLPIYVPAKGSVQICLRITDAVVGMNDTLIIAGTTAVENCPHCFYHFFKVDTDPPSPPQTSDVVTGIYGADGAERMALFPNPANERVTVRVRINSREDIRLSVVDASGKTVAVLVEDSFPAGEHLFAASVNGLAPGAYFMRLEQGGEVTAIPMTIMR